MNIDGNFTKIIADHFREYKIMVLKDERNRITSKIRQLELHDNSPKQLEKVYNIICSLVVDSDLTIEDVFDRLDINDILKKEPNFTNHTGDNFDW